MNQEDQSFLKSVIAKHPQVEALEPYDPKGWLIRVKRGYNIFNSSTAKANTIEGVMKLLENINLGAPKHN